MVVDVPPVQQRTANVAFSPKATRKGRRSPILTSSDSFAPFRLQLSPLMLRSLFSFRNLRVSVTLTTPPFRVLCFSRPPPSANFSSSSGRALSSSTSSLPSRFTGCARFVSDMAGNPSNSAASVHDFTVKDARGNDVDLSTYKGKVLLIVNVASQCGLTNSNYTELGQLYQKYKDKGFEILAFPCNQFGGQEPGTNEQIVEFACTRFKAEYPIFDKVDVNGENTAPMYKFLKSSKGGLFGDGIKWNFAKFLIDKEGHVVDRYAPTTSPLSLEKDIKKLLSVA